MNDFAATTLIHIFFYTFNKVFFFWEFKREGTSTVITYCPHDQICWGQTFWMIPASIRLQTFIRVCHVDSELWIKVLRMLNLTPKHPDLMKLMKLSVRGRSDAIGQKQPVDLSCPTALSSATKIIVSFCILPLTIRHRIARDPLTNLITLLHSLPISSSASFTCQKSIDGHQVVHQFSQEFTTFCQSL